MAGKDLWTVVEYYQAYNERDGICGRYRNEVEKFDSSEAAGKFISQIHNEDYFDPDALYVVEYQGPVGPVHGCKNIDTTPF